jgi:hypothetical protein
MAAVGLQWLVLLWGCVMGKSIARSAVAPNFRVPDVFVLWFSPSLT